MISKAMAVALAIALAFVVASLAAVSVKLYFTTTELSACKEQKASIEGELNLQSEKVLALGREPDAAKVRYRDAIKKLKDAGAATASLSAELGLIKLTGAECGAAMPIVNRVIEATR